MEISEFRKLEEPIKVKELPLTYDGAFRYFYIKLNKIAGINSITIVGTKFSKYIQRDWFNKIECVHKYDVHNNNVILASSNRYIIRRESDDCVLILLPKTITGEVTVFSQLSYSDHVVKFVDDCKFEINYTKEYDKIIKVISLYTSSEHGKLKISVTDKDPYSYESYLKNLTIVTNTFKDEECMKSFKFSSYVFMYYLYCKEMNNNRGIKLK